MREDQLELFSLGASARRDAADQLADEVLALIRAKERGLWVYLAEAPPSRAPLAPLPPKCETIDLAAWVDRR